MIPSGNCKIGIGSVAIAPDDAIVVIDELRASSTVVTACGLGVTEIEPLRDDDRAFYLQQNGVVIAGESGCLKIEGYDIGNSPVELAAFVSDHPFSKLALKTTNLVPLLLRIPHAIICSSLNLQAVAQRIRGRTVSIIAAGGTHGAAEDCAVALGLAALLNGTEFPADAVLSCVRESAAARFLCSQGFGDDVAFIARLNLFDVVPYFDGRVIIPT
ncbi:MAG: 2-phosphosulfolactate phosphatase [Desulfobacterota bacterium]|nr:2-phosphosulfolactate phosphatase [Thermodesulfobacteriota bacterium]